MEGQVIENQEPKQEVVVSKGNDIMAMMIQAAEHMDVEKLSRLMDLQERMLDRNAKAEFAADFVRMKPHLPKVIRTRENAQTKSRYAPLDDINTAIDPVLEPFGFGTAAKLVGQTEATVTVKAELWHRGGHVEETTITMPLDNKGIQGTVNKTLPHATSSSITYAKRVAICALLNISTGDDKDGNDDSSVLDNEKAVEIDLLIAEVGADKAKFLKYMMVSGVQDILAKDYEKAKKLLNDKRKKGKSNAA